MPDLDLITADGPHRVFELLHDARPLLLNLGRPGDFDITPWADRVQLIDAGYEGEWELPMLAVVSAPTAVLIRPDGYLAWVADGTQLGLPDALATWFGPRARSRSGDRSAASGAAPRSDRRTHLEHEPLVVRRAGRRLRLRRKGRDLRRADPPTLHATDPHRREREHVRNRTFQGGST